MIPLLLAVMLLLSGCSTNQKAARPDDLSLLYQQMAEQADLPAMITLDAELALDLFGIDVSDCTQWLFMLSEDSLLADEVVLLKAKDQKAAREMAELLKLRMEAKAAEARNYSPEQFAVIERGQVYEKGLELALLVARDIDNLTKAYAP